MTRDKLITIRIESEKREAFKRWAEARGVDVSGFLYDVIDSCLANRIDERILKGELDTERIDRIVSQRIDACLDERMESAIAALRREFQPALDALPELEALRKN